LLTDGLQAEREQGITIDVAYRYFTTGTRKYIIADAPGHEQYTRNMVTAASTADLAIILIDARKGVLTQTRRHSYLTHLVNIPHLVVAINKMDLVDYSQDVFNQIMADYLDFAAKLGIEGRALHPDVGAQRRHGRRTRRPARLVQGPDAARPAGDRHRLARRARRALPLPRAIRLPPAGLGEPGTARLPRLHGPRRIGRIAIGDAVTVLPSGRESRVKDIQHPRPDRCRLAIAEQSITILLLRAPRLHQRKAADADKNGAEHVKERSPDADRVHVPPRLA
jgi:sulfate adenylyltransferase subunit 1